MVFRKVPGEKYLAREQADTALSEENRGKNRNGATSPHAGDRIAQPVFKIRKKI